MARNELTLELTNGGADLTAAREATLELALSMGFSGQDLWSIVAAVFEACVNAVTYGSKGSSEPVVLHLRAHDDRFEAVVKDFGPGFACPPVIRMPPPPTPRGRGIPMMKMFMDRVEFDNRNGCQVTLVKYLPEED